MSQDFSNKVQQEQNLTLGDVVVEGVGHYIDFSQQQIIYISVDEIKTREFIQTSPYKGLKRFDSNEWDVKRFFGRAQFIDGLLAELNESNLILLLGASGSGKSSVVRAGLIPWLSKQWGTNFVSLIFTPDKDPFESLYTSLAIQFGQTDTQIARQANSETLVRVVKALKQPTSHWFIFIDQFEEFFTTSQPEKRDQFVSSLVRLIKELDKIQNLSVKLVAAMRADFLNRLSPYRDLIRITDKHRPIIAEMQPDELRLAIEQPAAHQGVVFEEGLVEEIIKDVWGQAGYLPLLQYTLNLLWETEVRTGSIQDRTLNTNTYRTLGGVRGALQKHVDEIYEALPAPEQSVTQRIFLKLVSIGEDEQSGTEWKPVRRRVPLSEFNEPLEKQVLKRLVDFSLLVSNRPIELQDATIEIAHEALLTSWTTLNTWIKENRQAIALRNRLNDDVARWQHNKNEDELWTGSKLEQVLELRRDEAFNQVLGGLSQLANQFIDTSLGLRERRRRRTLIGLAGFSAVALFLASVAGWQWWRVEEQRKIALARQLAAQSQVIREQQFNLLPRSTLLAIESMRRYSSVEADQALRSSLALLPRPSFSNKYEDGLNDVTFSPNGKYLAIAGNDDITRVLEAASGQEVFQIKQGDDVWDVAFSLDSNYLAIASNDQSGVVVDVSTGNEIARMPHEDRVKKVAFSGNGEYLFTLTWKGNFRAWEIASTKEVVHLPAVKDFDLTQDGNILAVAESNKVMLMRTDKSITVGKTSDISVRSLQHSEDFDSIALSPDGLYIATSERNNGITRLWEVATGKELLSWRLEGLMDTIVFSPNSQYLVATSGNPGGALSTQNSMTLVVEVPGGKEVAQIKNEVIVSDITFSPDSKFLVTSGLPRVWELESGREVFRLGNQACGNVSFSPSGQSVALSCLDTLQAWQLSSGGEVHRLSLQDYTRGFDSSPDGKYMAAGGTNGVVRVWKINGSQEIAQLDSLDDIWDIKFSSDSQYLVVADEGEGVVYIWKYLEPQQIRQIEVKDVSTISLSPNGNYIATISSDNDKVCLWEMLSGLNISCNKLDSPRTIIFNHDSQYLAVLDSAGNIYVLKVPNMQEITRMHHDSFGEGEVGGYGFSAVSFSLNGKYLLSVADSLDVRIWDFRTGHEISRLQNSSGITSVDFSSNSAYVATAGYDNNIRIWDPRSGREIVSMLHEDQAWSVSFSQDSNYLVTASDDYTTRVWEVPAGKELSRIRHAYPPYFATFTADSRNLVSLTLDEVLSVWLLWPEDLINESCRRLSNNLSREEWSQYIGNEPYRKTCPNLP